MKVKYAEEFVYRAVALGDLEIDSEGRVWRVAWRGGDRWNHGTRRIVCSRRRAEHCSGGYLQVRLMMNWHRISACAHRLVWRHFNGPIPDGLVINHKNGMKTDNRPGNLEVVTCSENTKHAYRHGLHNQFGERNPGAKVSDKQVAEIRLAYSSGGYTQSQLAARYGISFQHISAIVRGDARSKQAGTIGSYEHLRGRNKIRDPKTGRFIHGHKIPFSEFPEDLQIREIPEAMRV